MDTDSMRDHCKGHEYDLNTFTTMNDIGKLAMSVIERGIKE